MTVSSSCCVKQRTIFTAHPIASAQRADDASGVARAAHDIRGSAANIGADELAACAARIEIAAKDGKTAAGAADELHAAIAALDDAIAAYVSNGFVPDYRTATNIV